MKNPTVTLNPPSTQVVEKAALEHVLTDGRGRKITIKKPGVLAQFRLVEVLGDTAKNQVYTGMVMPIIYVTKIDADDVFFPAKKSELEALIQRLDEDGIECVHKGVVEHFSLADPEKEKEQLKK